MSREHKACGTPSGHRRHEKAGERPCEACREARNAYQREVARRSRAWREVPLPVASPEDAHRAPCYANPGLWDPRDEWEAVDSVRARWAEAARLCVTACPVFTFCSESLPVGEFAGVVAGRVPGRVS